MQKAKLFNNGRSQAVRLPKEFRFKGENVIIKRMGNAVVLIPEDDPWSPLLNAMGKMPDDFMEHGRNQPAQQQTREDPFE